MKILIGTEGFIHESWRKENTFYPSDCVDSAKQLEYYSSKFDTVTLTSTFMHIPSSEVYYKWIKSVSSNKRFSFMITAPKLFTQSALAPALATWNDFWFGKREKDGSLAGGCDILYDKGKLGCIILHFDRFFDCKQKNIIKINKLTANIPSDVKLCFEFLNRSWIDNPDIIEDIFENKKWCISTLYLENGLVNYGWAGNLPSTRTKTAFLSPKNKFPIITNSNFIRVVFYGTYGPKMGSYDKDMFLENFVKYICKFAGKLDIIYCSFHNTESSVCYPLPMISISGIILFPQLETLPEGVEEDSPCCLHDTSKLKNLFLEALYDKDSDGKYLLDFVYK